MNIFMIIIVKIIRLYQVAISPLIGSNCRYSPTCSTYSIKSFKRYGLLKGGKLSIKRILSCHPFGNSGYDPVP